MEVAPATHLPNQSTILAAQCPTQILSSLIVAPKLCATLKDQFSTADTSTSTFIKGRHSIFGRFTQTRTRRAVRVLSTTHLTRSPATSLLLKLEGTIIKIPSS